MAGFYLTELLASKIWRQNRAEQKQGSLAEKAINLWLNNQKVPLLWVLALTLPHVIGLVTFPHCGSLSQLESQMGKIISDQDT